MNKRDLCFSGKLQKTKDFWAVANCLTVSGAEEGVVYLDNLEARASLSRCSVLVEKPHVTPTQIPALRDGHFQAQAFVWLSSRHVVRMPRHRGSAPPEVKNPAAA